MYFKGVLSGKGAGKQGPVGERRQTCTWFQLESWLSLTPPGAPGHELHPEFAPPGDEGPVFCVSCELLVATVHKSWGTGVLVGKGIQVGCKACAVERQGQCGRSREGFEIRPGFSPRLFTLSASFNHLVPQSPHLCCEGDDFCSPEL